GPPGRRGDRPGDGLHVVDPHAGQHALAARVALRRPPQHRLVRGLRRDAPRGAPPHRRRGAAPPPGQRRERARARRRGGPPQVRRPGGGAARLRALARRGPDHRRPLARPLVAAALGPHRRHAPGPGGRRVRRPGGLHRRGIRPGVGEVTLRAKILLAQTPLAGALVLIAILSALTNATLGRNASSILQDNYRSVLAAERMKEALERIDSAAMFIVAGERQRGTAQAEQNFLRFEQALATQQSNITERGEPEATGLLRRNWAAYRAAYAHFVGGTAHDALEADYFRTMNPLFVNTKNAADRILDLNQDAMVRKRDQARRATERSNAVMIATALLASLIGLIGSTIFTRRILRPLSVLGQTARRLGEGDMEVRAKVSRQDEIGALARDFNLMADKLAQYRKSSLGELLQAQQQAQAAIDSLPDPVLI